MSTEAERGLGEVECLGDAGLDEPSAAALPGVLKREGRTLVVATHDVERGKAIADRIVTLDRGRIEGWDGFFPLSDENPAHPPGLS